MCHEHLRLAHSLAHFSTQSNRFRFHFLALSPPHLRLNPFGWKKFINHLICVVAISSTAWL